MLLDALGELAAAALVELSAETVAPRRASKRFVVGRIVAVEAKISNWREALRQAVANTWFASHSYVLLPVEKAHEQVLVEARRLGVGVLVSDGASTRIVVRSPRYTIPASYGSWLVNEWVVQASQRGAARDRDCSQGRIP